MTGFLRGNKNERYCRNGEETGDKYKCTYGCPANSNGCGICSKTMMMLFPIMEAVRSGGDLQNIGGSGKYVKDIVCPMGVFCSGLRQQKQETRIFIKADFLNDIVNKGYILLALTTYFINNTMKGLNNF